MTSMQRIPFDHIRSRVLGADFYPFKPGGKVGPRLPYAHSFIYITEGRGTVTLEGTTYEAEPRDLFYIEPSMEHSYAADPQQPMVHASVYVDLLWDSTSKPVGDKRLNCYSHAAYDPGLCAARVAFEEEIRLPVRTRVPQHSDWMEAYKSVIRSFEKRNPWSLIELRSLFEQFLTGFARFLAHPYEPSDPRIRRIIDWMNGHLKDAFHLSSWSRSLQLSEAYLYELFRAETGYSPQHYFLRRRLEQAKAELRETNDSVTSIAERLGFASIHYFSRQFTRVQQESPQQYRKRIRSYEA